MDHLLAVLNKYLSILLLIVSNQKSVCIQHTLFLLVLMILLDQFSKLVQSRQNQLVPTFRFSYSWLSLPTFCRYACYKVTKPPSTSSSAPITKNESVRFASPWGIAGKEERDFGNFFWCAPTFHQNLLHDASLCLLQNFDG